MEDYKPVKSRYTIFLAIGGICALLAACLAAAVLGVGGLWLALHPAQAVVEAQDNPPGEVNRAGPSEEQRELEITTPLAQIVSVRGLVEKQSVGSAWSSVGDGQELLTGQSLRVANYSQAEMDLPDGSRITLSGDSEIVLEELSFDPLSGRRVVVIYQARGESSHSVAVASGAESLYEVHTPDGSATAQGTQFNVTVTAEDGTRLNVTKGQVAVTGQTETVQVEAGQATIVSSGAPPSEPALFISGEGEVTQIGDTWIIAGQIFSVHPDTVIVGDPQVGDIVLVEGRLLADGTRLADLIVLKHSSPANHFSLTGEVQDIQPDSWTVAGQTIAVNDRTQIDSVISVGDWAQIEGVILDGGGFQALRISPAGPQAGLPFEFAGIVQTMGAEEWQISGISIHLDANTMLDDGLTIGDIVRVTGKIQADGIWLAERIHLDTSGGRSFELTGRLDSLSPWQVAGITFETRDWTEIDPDLVAGDLVHVEGIIQSDGTWLAAEIHKISDQTTASIILIGTVISTDPWVVSGIPLVVTPDTVISGDILPGMLVRVEILLLPDGTWQVVRIVSLRIFAWMPGCMDLTATVVSYQDGNLQLLGWPVLRSGEDFEFDGDLVANSIVQIRICVQGEGIVQIVQIIIVYQPDEAIQPPISNGKVTICHKPNKKKGGNTLSISPSALPAHLGHGDTLGPCGP